MKFHVAVVTVGALAWLLVACDTAPENGTTIVAAGDIACDPADSNFDGGDGTSDHCQQAATANLISNLSPAAVLALGDLQYDCAGAQAFQESYDPTWGQFKDITHPVPGNQEYNPSGGTDCDLTGNAAGYFGYFGAAAGDQGDGWYSFDLAGWHFIALNSNCNEVDCDTGSPQQEWLRDDLDAHSNFCTLAFWHHPRFSSGSSGNEDDVSPFWEQLHEAGADVVLNSHDHGYERFAPQDPEKRPDPSGMREFVVGTGGEDFGSFDDSPDENSEIQNSGTFGVLELTLHPTSYEWSFVPTSEGSFVDSGAGECH